MSASPVFEAGFRRGRGSTRPKSFGSSAFLLARPAVPNTHRARRDRADSDHGRYGAAARAIHWDNGGILAWASGSGRSRTHGRSAWQQTGEDPADEANETVGLKREFNYSDHSAAS